MFQMYSRVIIVILLVSSAHFIQIGAGPIHSIRVHNAPIKQQQPASQGTYHPQTAGVNGAVNGQIVQPSYPSQLIYNNEYADFQEAFQHQQQQRPSPSAQNPNRNIVKDDSHKITQPIYRNQQDPQFQNYLYQKQKLDSRQKSQDLHSVKNNPNERSSQPTTRGGQVQMENGQICTSTGCRNLNEQVKSQQNQNQPALHEMHQPQLHQYHTNSEKSRYKAKNYVVESNNNFLLPSSAGNNNGNNRANILDARKARALENKDVGQRNNLPYRPHPNSFVPPSALLPSPLDTKNKGQNTGLVKIEFDFEDKDVNDTYETTMELVSDEL